VAASAGYKSSAGISTSALGAALPRGGCVVAPAGAPAPELLTRFGSFPATAPASTTAATPPNTRATTVGTLSSVDSGTPEYYSSGAQWPVGAARWRPESDSTTLSGTPAPHVEGIPTVVQATWRRPRAVGMPLLTLLAATATRRAALAAWPALAVRPARARARGSRRAAAARLQTPARALILGPILLFFHGLLLLAAGTLPAFIPEDAPAPQPLQPAAAFFRNQDGAPTSCTADTRTPAR
jgi:hypothetical protein